MTDDVVDVGEKLSELRTYLRRRPDLVINRVPRKELAWFKQWAQDEFEDNWGFAFKYLCQGYMPPELTDLQNQVDALQQRIVALENREQSGENVRAPIRNVLGKVIG